MYGREARLPIDTAQPRKEDKTPLELSLDEMEIMNGFQKKIYHQAGDNVRNAQA